MSDLAPATIHCPDCGGPCGLLSHPPPDGFWPGDIVAYRCRDCGDRWDVELADPDDPADADDPASTAD